MATIPETLKTMLETEIAKGTGGRLNALKGVYTGNIELFPEDKYPLVNIVSMPSRYPYNGNHIELSREYSLVIHVIGSSLSASEALRDQLVFDEQSTPYNGIIPFFLANRGFKIGTVLYGITIGDTETVIGKDKMGRDSAAADIPITIGTTIELK